MESIAQSLPYYREALGFERASEVVEIRSQGVRVCFVETAPGIYLELVEASGERSPLKALLEREIRYYHVCYAVPDVSESIESLRSHRFRMVSRFDSEAFGGKPCAFLYAPDRTLVELCMEGSFDLL